MDLIRNFGEVMDIKNYCFICGEELLEGSNKCKKCGYEYTIEDICPRLQKGICIHTNDFCVKGDDYYNCDILRRFD